MNIHEVIVTWLNFLIWIDVTKKSIVVLVSPWGTLSSFLCHVVLYFYFKRCQDSNRIMYGTYMFYIPCRTLDIYSSPRASNLLKFEAAGNLCSLFMDVVIVLHGMISFIILHRINSNSCLYCLFRRCLWWFLLLFCIYTCILNE